MAVQHFTTESFDTEVAQGTTIVDFWATWCGPCRMQAPILEGFEAKYGDQVKVGKVDTDEEPELAQRFNIFSIPTLIAIKDGVEVARVVGVTPEDGLKQLAGI